MDSRGAPIAPQARSSVRISAVLGSSDGHGSAQLVLDLKDDLLTGTLVSDEPKQPFQSFWAWPSVPIATTQVVAGAKRVGCDDRGILSAIRHRKPQKTSFVNFKNKWFAAMK
jgi:hypothetical protein